MKTTIDIPDTLAQDAKALARAEGSSLRDLVVTGLRREIERRTRHERTNFILPTFGGDGLALDLPPEEVVAYSYGLSE